ncbi:PREDICTED: uncharacterized protein LOC106327602 [Brassica oleracea var. oleracea]|uniref:Uncharacterized protein n=1 Tax=Brassica oleracea var. oleracea TaxID=109376 RepID=A0A0D3AQV0_BRAOL|nr:PREDICTED: uncharacterized protein LOC106327602 [Brassica oleracea var. oleracea]XP_013621244.1 PREDICTED: uncharacterized protein LOC106327602 [Brassica oleracea var. oleracea]XP_013621245.1 PREDICTED: uncharacterized protein LOC106327602 [Brassica oleracea var. oleracea]
MEMGRRDMRRGRGANRSSKKKSSGSVVSAKQKKGTLKKLSLAADDERMNHKKQEMMMCYDFPASDLENEVVSLKKKKKSSKLLKKSLKESNGVVHPHASVPRKLRSAMKKRNLESVSNLSSPSKRLNRSITGIESLNMDLVNKENQETDAKAIVVSKSMMISKDEEEVAETLFGLADMFNEAGSVDKETCDALLSDDDDDKEPTKADSVLVVETGFTTKDESLEPAVSVLSSDKTKQLDEIPLQQSSSVNVTDAPARAMEAKAATCDINYKSNGLGLWPGLSSTRPSSTKLPPWMGQALSSPTKNASPLSVRPRKLKRCASHIYICQLIKALQTRESNQTEQRSSETPQYRVPDPVTTTSDFKSNVAPSIRCQNPHLIDLYKTCNPKPVQEDQAQLSLELYGPKTTQKQEQSYDFLSLSSNGASQSHPPFPNSFPQYPPISAAYNSHLSPALPSHQMQQMSPYLASRYQTAYNANHHHQQQQLQKRMWAAAQYRPLTNGNTVVQPLSNQYSKPNLSLNLTSIQPLQVTSSPRYNNNVFQQQRRLMSAAAAMSMNHHHSNIRSRTVMNRQEHHFPLIYEDTRTPLQLLCNEQT